MNHLPVALEGTGIYVIDEDYRIIYLNETAKIAYPDLKEGMTCYQGICNGSSPCGSCPGMSRDCSRVLVYNAVNRQWVELSSGRLEWPGHGKCCLMLFKVVDRQSRSLFYDLTETSIYEELFELNLEKNTYKILFHQNGKYVIPDMEGQLDAMCAEVADHMIHPEDRERFLEFWDFDSLIRRLSGRDHTVRGEFRKLLVSGEYCWAAQTVVLLHTGEREETVIMVFIQDIDEQKKQETIALKSGRGSLEERDSMMGLYRYGPFLEKADQFLKEKSGSTFSMVAIDIEHFKLFNEWYGEEAGDRFLISIAEQLKEVEKQYDSVAGYMGGDDFAVIIPRDESILLNLEHGIKNFVKQYGGSVGFLPAFGVYEIEDGTISISMMYDRASIALSSVKGNYLNRTGRYDAGMKKKMEDDQVLLSEIQRALDNHEFVFYAQPQCNMLTGRIIGMESLVRWIHPVRGVVQPGEFIPLLESNGFITNLDLYVWELVCGRLHDWIAAGHRPVPISINVSRIDIYSMNVTKTLKELTGHYEIDPYLLEIEITESAYAEDYNLIRQVVDDLRKAGFTVFMDDFGSGYSSLNMLKDVNVDVIKIDTKFLDMNEHSQNRGMGIVETIVRMARLMQLRVIAEGVEKKEQADFLRNVGCIYGQGYYYYRPMPIEQFEPLLLEEENVDYRGIQARQMEELCLEDLVNEDMTSETILNNMLGGMALYDVCGKKVEVLRVNQEYYKVTGCNPVDLEERRRFTMAQILDEDRNKVLQIFEDAYKNPLVGAEGTVRRYRLNGELMWLSLQVFFLKESGGHRIFYGAISDVTKVKEQEERLALSQEMLTDAVDSRMKLENANEILQFQNDELEFLSVDAPGGYHRCQWTENLEFLYVSSRFLEILGYTRRELTEEFMDCMTSLIHPDDRTRVLSAIMKEENTAYSMEFRVKAKRGYIWVRYQTNRRCLTDITLVYGIILDIDEIIVLRRELQACRERLGELESHRQIGTDPLTGLYDRKTAVPIMKEWISKRRGQQSAFVLFHFCGFREVDEEYGQIAGERVLVNRVERLKSFFREEDIVCSISRDEILVLCKNIGENDMRRKLERLMENMQTEPDPELGKIRLSVNAGYVMAADGTEDFDDLYVKAKKALKKASSCGKGICLRYEQKAFD